MIETPMSIKITRPKKQILGFGISPYMFDQSKYFIPDLMNIKPRRSYFIGRVIS